MVFIPAKIVYDEVGWKGSISDPESNVQYHNGRKTLSLNPISLGGNTHGLSFFIKGGGEVSLTGKEDVMKLIKHLTSILSEIKE